MRAYTLKIIPCYDLRFVMYNTIYVNNLWNKRMLQPTTTIENILYTYLLVQYEQFLRYRF
jgi:hypothetical protein